MKFLLPLSSISTPTTPVSTSEVSGQDNKGLLTPTSTAAAVGVTLVPSSSTTSPTSNAAEEVIPPSVAPFEPIVEIKEEPEAKKPRLDTGDSQEGKL